MGIFYALWDFVVSLCAFVLFLLWLFWLLLFIFVLIVFVLLVIVIVFMLLLGLLIFSFVLVSSCGSLIYCILFFIFTIFLSFLFILFIILFLLIFTLLFLLLLFLLLFFLLFFMTLLRLLLLILILFFLFADNICRRRLLTILWYLCLLFLFFCQHQCFYLPFFTVYIIFLGYLWIQNYCILFFFVFLYQKFVILACFHLFNHIPHNIQLNAFLSFLIPTQCNLAKIGNRLRRTHNSRFLNLTPITKVLFLHYVLYSHQHTLRQTHTYLYFIKSQSYLFIALLYIIWYFLCFRVCCSDVDCLWVG